MRNNKKDLIKNNKAIKVKLKMKKNISKNKSQLLLEILYPTKKFGTRKIANK
jgi:hypothetical protein